MAEPLGLIADISSIKKISEIIRSELFFDNGDPETERSMQALEQNVATIIEGVSMLTDLASPPPISVKFELQSCLWSLLKALDAAKTFHTTKSTPFTKRSSVKKAKEDLADKLGKFDINAHKLVRLAQNHTEMATLRIDVKAKRIRPQGIFDEFKLPRVVTEKAATEVDSAAEDEDDGVGDSTEPKELDKSNEPGDRRRLALGEYLAVHDRDSKWTRKPTPKVRTADPFNQIDSAAEDEDDGVGDSTEPEDLDKSNEPGDRRRLALGKYPPVHDQDSKWTKKRTPKVRTADLFNQIGDICVPSSKREGVIWHPVKIQIDTRSKFNIVSREVLSEAGFDGPYEKPKPAECLTMGGPMDLKDRVTLSWSLHNALKVQRSRFYIVNDPPFDVLIGTHVIEKHEVLQDIQPRRYLMVNLNITGRTKVEIAKAEEDRDRKDLEYLSRRSARNPGTPGTMTSIGGASGSNAPSGPAWQT